MLSIQELRTSTKKELENELKSAQKDIQRIKINVKTKHTKDTSLVLKQAKYIAQIKTVMKELHIEEIVSKAVEV